MKNNIYTYSSINYRDKRFGTGFQFDFMVLVKDEIEYPFINIYYFYDNNNSHEHFIIDIEGNLEVCHRNLESKYYKKKINGTTNLLFKLLIHESFVNAGIYINNLNDLNLISKKKYIFDKLKFGKREQYNDMLKRYNEYIFLIKHAVSKYSNLSYNEVTIIELMTVIKSIKNILPDSNMDVNKSSIIKRR